jgi:hypothetical protein
MSNKRVSQLVELTAAEVQGGDFFYVIDVSAREGKKIQADSLADYLAASGSLDAVNATNADTASYVLGSNVHGSVAAATWAGHASESLASNFASSSISASYAVTASFAMNSTAGSSVSASWASSSISASYALKASTADNATLAGRLSYSGGDNGTASYAIKARFTETTDFAATASYISGSGPTVATASYALKSGLADVSTVANSSQFLTFTGGDNGTASYALTAGGYVSNTYLDFGLTLATTQSISSSQVDRVSVTASLATTQSTIIEAFGTVIVPYTSSIPVNETLTLVVKDRNTGLNTTFDSTPIYVDMSRTVNNWDSLATGSVRMPYTLIGSSSLYGDYLVYVTGSSSKIQIDSSRTNRFTVHSKSDIVNTSVDEPLMFNLSAVGAYTIQFTSSFGGPFTDSLTGMLSTGSTNILHVNLDNKGITSVRYAWTLSNMTDLNCRRNAVLTRLGGMPNTLRSLICDSCSISLISSLSNTVVTYLDCSDNFLPDMPALPTSMSYLNCSFNQLTELEVLPNTCSYLNASNNDIAVVPTSFPFALTELYLNQNDISSLTTTLPNSIVTMSVANNASLSNWGASMPTSMKRLDISYTSISIIPTIPPLLLYLNATSASLNTSTMDTICSQSVVNGLSNGFIYLNGNGPVMISTENNYILPLQGLGWTIGYDGSA